MANPISLERTDIHVKVGLVAVACASPQMGIILGIGTYAAHAINDVRISAQIVVKAKDNWGKKAIVIGEEEQLAMSRIYQRANRCQQIRQAVKSSSCVIL